MRLKSYFSDSVEHALAIARRELGPDAILLNSSRNAASNDPSECYEVVFGVIDEPANAARKDSTPASALDGIREEIGDLARLLRSMAKAQKNGSDTSGRQFWRERLAANDFSEALIEKLLGADGFAGGSGPSAVQGRSIRDELLRLVRQEDPFERPDAPAMALVGPPGAGKTSLIAKLAIRYGVLPGRRVKIIAADPVRVGASEQLRAYSEIMGAAFVHTADLHQLIHVLKERNREEFVLIDTPGFGFRDREALVEQASAFNSLPNLRTHLVLPVSLCTADLERYWQLYQPFGFASLLFTRLDETPKRGGMFSLAVQSSLPVSHVSTGQSIPEDLEKVNLEDLTKPLTDLNERIEFVA